MKEYTWVNMLKLKASIGQQGNDDLLYSDGTRNYYPSSDQFKMTGANGVFSDGALYYKGNKDLTWETSTPYNIGVDFACSTTDSMVQSNISVVNQAICFTTNR